MAPETTTTLSLSGSDGSPFLGTRDRLGTYFSGHGSVSYHSRLLPSGPGEEEVCGEGKEQRVEGEGRCLRRRGQVQCVVVTPRPLRQGLSRTALGDGEGPGGGHGRDTAPPLEPVGRPETDTRPAPARVEVVLHSGTPRVPTRVLPGGPSPDGRRRNRPSHVRRSMATRHPGTEGLRKCRPNLERGNGQTPPTPLS